MKFNLAKPVKIATQATGSISCVEVQKLPEGNFNKVLLLTMNDGKEVIAKLPNSNAGPQYFTTASEVRNIGAEYIIMEKSQGVELSKLWDDILGPDKLGIFQQLVDFEKALVSPQFPMHGSPYYAKDLPNVQSNQLIDLGAKRSNAGLDSAVGPTTNRTFFDDGRNSVDAGHRGPYKEVSKAALWHPDLHGDNIFVDPDQPTGILSIIDWQAVNLSPLFLQVRHPALIEFDGPIPKGLQSIRLPENFDELSAEEQLGAKKLCAAQSLYKLYDIEMIQQCPEIAAALQFKYSLAGQITGLSDSVFGDGEPIVQGMLIRLQEEWTTHVGSSLPCSLSFTEEGKKKQKEDEEKWASRVVIEDFLDHGV
ncbi:Aminoglycoside phosphotransferase [Penicillium concentricum]|uniref:Altered inheritance of mitochondria protein 9, mitochondrial n=1 Tax=Penicillium concentricum TaxID=293559 RepID=A0A9W9SAK1_9EURO|nr:Aminoglycoside phosphotransferase [Penicillium concentricum]KAJ5375106.1 Aminoglycoside phosphotransferase [Penicillium concentricum]